MENKPAESARDYLEVEDQRLCNELVKIIQALRQGLCPDGVPRALSYPIVQEARKQYRQREKDATLFWGQYEVAEVRSTQRKDRVGYIGAFIDNF